MSIKNQYLAKRGVDIKGNKKERDGGGGTKG